MMSYEVIITSDAAADLIEVRNYIADVLLAPDIALSYMRALRAAMHTLSELPERGRLLSEEPWHSLSVRTINAKNFLIYYRIVPDMRKVYILNVFYKKRNQLRILAQRNRRK